ncbi:MAG: response regulator, partial [Bacteriovoracia bacterium]
MNDKPRILLIDDEKDILSLLGAFLESEGFCVETAENGELAWKKINSNSFSAVVCDLKMPVMDGLTLLKKIREAKNFIPFVFLSGHANLDDEHEVINYGSYELIHKPHIDKVPIALRALLKADKEVKSLEKSGVHAIDFLEILHEASIKKVS